MIFRTLLCSLALSFTLSVQAVTNTTTSTFITSLDGWEPNSPWTSSTVGAIVPGNPFLRITPNGIGGRGSRMITFNPTADWTGDYIGAGVTGIRMDVANRAGSDPLDLRIVIGNNGNPQQSGGTWWISDSAITIAAGTDWTTYYMPLGENDLNRVGNLLGELGTDSYADTFSDVKNIRILSSTVGQSPIGDLFVGDVGIDNITLVPEPRQIALGFGLLAMIVAMRRRKTNK